MPSNASKEWSGTHQELEERRKKLEGVAERIVERHRQRDQEEDAGKAASETKKVERFRRKIEQIKEFLEKSEKRLGPTGKEQKSNVTDPDSAKMASSRGVIQGYNGLAVVDDRANGTDLILSHRILMESAREHPDLRVYRLATVWRRFSVAVCSPVGVEIRKRQACSVVPTGVPVARARPASGSREVCCLKPRLTNA